MSRHRNRSRRLHSFRPAVVETLDERQVPAVFTPLISPIAGLVSTPFASLPTTVDSNALLTTPLASFAAGTAANPFLNGGLAFDFGLLSPFAGSFVSNGTFAGGFVTPSVLSGLNSTVTAPVSPFNTSLFTSGLSGMNTSGLFTSGVVPSTNDLVLSSTGLNSNVALPSSVLATNFFGAATTTPLALVNGITTTSPLSSAGIVTPTNTGVLLFNNDLGATTGLNTGFVLNSGLASTPISLITPVTPLSPFLNTTNSTFTTNPFVTPGGFSTTFTTNPFISPVSGFSPFGILS